MSSENLTFILARRFGNVASSCLFSRNDCKANGKGTDSSLCFSCSACEQVSNCVPTRENFTQSGFNFAQTPSIKTETASPSVIDAGSHALGQHKFIDFSHNREEAKKFFVGFATRKRLSSPLASSDRAASSSNFAAHSLVHANALVSAKSAIQSASSSDVFQKGFLVFGCSFAQLKMRCIQKCLPRFHRQRKICYVLFVADEIELSHTPRTCRLRKQFGQQPVCHNMCATLLRTSSRSWKTTCQQQFSACSCHAHPLEPLRLCGLHGHHCQL